MMSLGTLLVAEDDAAIADVLVEVLTEEGYAVQVVATGADALQALQTEPLDLALIDLAMPGLSGLEVLEGAHAQQIDVPIVIMTARTRVTEELTAAGARTCLYKPFELDELLSCVLEHIRRSLTDEPAG
jgi:DNA-binding response OmpR family regulator